jgi:hypothetical protein
MKTRNPIHVQSSVILADVLLGLEPDSQLQELSIVILELLVSFCCADYLFPRTFHKGYTSSV